MDEDLAQVVVAALADPIESCLAAGRILARHDAQLSRELSALVEGCPVADRGYDCRCDQRSDAGDLSQSYSGGVARSDPLDFIVHPSNLKLQILPLVPQHGQQVAHARREILLGVLKDLRHALATHDPGSGLRHMPPSRSGTSACSP